METGYCQLRQKEVINLKDGRKLGKVSDVIFTFPEGRVLGFMVPDGKGFFRPEIFIDLKDVRKIGEDTVLVELSGALPPPPKRGHGYFGRAERGQENCVPPPPPPRQNRYFDCDE